MADETNKPEMSDEELETVAASVPSPDEYPEGQAEELRDRMGEDANGVDEAVVAAIESSENATDSAPVKAFGNTMDAIEQSIESLGGVSDEAHEQAHGEHLMPHGDTTVVFGREYPFPLYTGVFMALGILTLIEVLIAEAISSDIKIPFLLGIAVAKAALVVLFYMHLKDDSRIFALTISIPLGLALLATVYLLAIPPTGY